MRRVHCIPNLGQIDSYLSFSKEFNAAFEYNEFFSPANLDDEKKLADIVNTYKSLDRDRSEDTLHGVFLDIVVNSADSLIYEASNKRVHQSMDIAQELGVKAVVFHTNYISNFTLESYRKDWVEKNVIYWKKILEEYPTLEIYIENMFDDDPELQAKLAERMKDEPRFGVCFDFAHAFVSTTPLSEWVDALKPYIKHLHINDNDQVQDLHNPVGAGQLPWGEYQAYIDTLEAEKRPSVLIEVRTIDDLMASVEYMKGNGLYPF